jgi:PIN domain nuclease of toxin-antitoxin system
MLDDAPQLGATVREEQTNPANDFCVSMVSIWEMALSVCSGKLHTDMAEVHRLPGATGLRGSSTFVPAIYCSLLRCPLTG